MGRSKKAQSTLLKRSLARNVIVLICLAGWLIPVASAILETYGSIAAAVVYGATYALLVTTFAIHLKLSSPSLIGIGVGLTFGLGTAAIASVFLNAAAQTAITGKADAVMSHVALPIIASFAIIPGLAGGIGTGFILGRMKVWRLLAIGAAAVLALTAMLGSWLYTPSLIWSATGAGVSFGLLSGFSVAVVLSETINRNAAVLRYGIPLGVSGAIAAALIMLDTRVHVSGHILSTGPWILLTAAAAGVGGSATIYLGQYIGSELARVGKLSAHDMLGPIADMKNYLRPLTTFISVYILIGIWFGLLYYGIDHFIVPHSFLIKRAYADGSVDTFGYSSSIEAIYYSFVTITTLGYGDIVPVRAWSKAASIIEVIIGTSWLVVYFAFLFAKLKTTDPASLSRKSRRR